MKKKQATSIQHDFFRQCPNLKGFCQLFEQFSHTYIILKERDGRYVYINLALAKRLKRKPADLIGMTDYDIYDQNLAKMYRQEDLHVLQSTREVVGELHQAVDGNGNYFWLRTVKKPVVDAQNQVVGVIGLMTDYQVIGDSIENYKQLKKILAYINENYASSLTVADLASMMKMSPSHFQRVFKKAFAITPMQMVSQRRLREARHLLLNSTKTVTEVAYLTGFFDHSHFCKKFKTELGMSPKEFRKSYLG